MKVCVVGTGYVGLVTGACLAEIGHHVVGVDLNQKKIDMLKRGEVPIYEPGLAELLGRGRSAGRVAFTTDLAGAVKEAEIVFITVGTPPRADGSADLSAVEAVAKGIGAAMERYTIVVNKSTVPVGCGDWVAMLVKAGQRERQVAAERQLVGASGTGPEGEGPAVTLTKTGARGTGKLNGADLIPFDVVSCPEFLREGTAIRDTFLADRIVIGSNSKAALATMRELYAPILEGEFAGGNGRRVPLIETDLQSAEMIKYAANCFLATKISFINEIANICERVGADVTRVAEGIGHDFRIGHAFLNAGIGWGGSCFPKDVSAMAHIAHEYGYDARLLREVIETNARQRQVALNKLQQRLKTLKGKTVGLLGLAFKPDTDDLRDAPAMTLASALLKLGARVQAYDPIAASHARAELPELELVDDPYLVAEEADAIVVATEWQKFAGLDMGRMRLAMNGPHFLLVDGRNVFDPSEMKALGFTYEGIGRGA